MVRYQRNEAGAIVETTAFDERGAPALTNEGWHRLEDVLAPTVASFAATTTAFAANACSTRTASAVFGGSAIRREIPCSPSSVPTIAWWSTSTGTRVGPRGATITEIPSRSRCSGSTANHRSATATTPSSGAGSTALDTRSRVLFLDRPESPSRSPSATAWHAIGSTTKVTDRNGRYFDESGRPVVPAKIGYATEIDERDARGRIRRTSYFDAEGRPKRDRRWSLRAGVRTRRGALARGRNAARRRAPARRARRLGEANHGMSARRWAHAPALLQGDGRESGAARSQDDGRHVCGREGDRCCHSHEARGSATRRASASAALGRRKVGGRRAVLRRSTAAPRGDPRREGNAADAAHQALEKAPFDGITEVVETDNGFFVMQRIR